MTGIDLFAGGGGFTQAAEDAETAPGAGFLCYARGANKALPRSTNCREHDTRRRRSDVSTTLSPSDKQLKGTTHAGIYVEPGMTSQQVVQQAIAAGHFEVRSDGTIWRLKQRYGGHGAVKTVTPRRAEYKLKIGYLGVKVDAGGRQCWGLAHRLVWEALRGPIPPGMEINHLDRDRANNHPSNLELVTPSENMEHAYNTPGPKPGPEGLDYAVLSGPAKALRQQGLYFRDIGQRLGISTTSAFKAVKF